MTVPWLLDHAPYTPFMHPRTAGPPGLSPLDLADWTVRHADFDAQMTRRAELLATRPEIVLGCLPDGEAPVRELAMALAAHLGRPVLADTAAPLESIGHAAAEDFCLLLPDEAAGEYRLVAAVLCFPSRWLLSEKLGHPLTVIHEPVPDYDSVLARRVNRVFETLRSDRPLVRVNWLVHAVPELHLPMGLSDKRMAAADVRGPFYLRTERQTLVRLPDTGAVVFGIKTSVTPISRLTGEQAAALRRGMARFDAAEMTYRAGADLIGNAIAELDRIACGGAQTGPSSGQS